MIDTPEICSQHHIPWTSQILLARKVYKIFLLTKLYLFNFPCLEIISSLFIYDISRKFPFENKNHLFSSAFFLLLNDSNIYYMHSIPVRLNYNSHFTVTMYHLGGDAKWRLDYIGLTYRHDCG